MKMTKAIKNIGVLALALLMVFAMTGCGGNKAEKKWEEDATAIMNDIATSQSEFYTVLTNIQPGNADSQSEMLNCIDTLEGNLNKLKALEAPEKFQPAQEDFNAAVDKALESLTSFREMANNLGEGGDLTVVSEKLAEGQTLYGDFLNLWQTAVNNLAEVVSE